MIKLHYISSALLLALTVVVALASCSNNDELPITAERHPLAFSSVTEEQMQLTRAGLQKQLTRAGLQKQLTRAGLQEQLTRAGLQKQLTRAEEQKQQTRAEEQMQLTRAASQLGRDFVVYAYKRVGEEEQEVINGYTVRYLQGSAYTSEDNTNDYYYVGGEQTLKYWDFGANEYHFWGVSAVSTDLYTFSGEKHNTLTIHDMPLHAGEPAPDDDVLYSGLLVRSPVSADVARLSFKRPYAKLRVQFYTTEEIGVGDHIDLTDISFAPDPAAASPLVNKVYGKGDVVVSYPLTTDKCSGSGQETVRVQNYSKPQDNLPFQAIQLTHELGISSDKAVTAPIDDSEGFRLDDMPGSPLKGGYRMADNEGMNPLTDSDNPTRADEVLGKKYYYYPLPMGELNPAFIMTVRINGDSELKTAVVPAVYMQWKPNFFYTYIFKITEAGKKIELYDVKVAPWIFGGRLEDEWKNW